MRRILSEDDKVSKEIRTSHLLGKDTQSSEKTQDTRLISRLKSQHLSKLQRMVFGTQTKVKGDDIRGTDVPIEYVFIFAFFFIGTIGAFVFYQVKKARSSLPMAGQKRLD